MLKLLWASLFSRRVCLPGSLRAAFVKKSWQHSIMGKPWIGIPTRYHAKSEYIGQIRHYLDAVLWAGGLPLMIPTTEDRDIIAEYVRRVHGILLPGSPTDIDPKHYGAVAHEKLGKLYPERDATDFAILDLVESQQNMP